MKIWEKGLAIDEEIENFTVGNDRKLDLELAPFDALASIAHAIMLAEVGLLNKSESVGIIKELQKIYWDCQKKHFIIQDQVEDVHSQIEWILIQNLGQSGKKIHTGRSRNDQVLTALRLYYRHAIWQMAQATQTLCHSLLEQSEKYKHYLMPGYTHMQVAMPSSFGLWFGAWAELLADDLAQLLLAYQLSDQNPLGSAAGYGSGLPINRQTTTHLLGFATLHYNVIAAQLSRGKTERSIATAIAALSATIARMSMDVCMFASQNYDFFHIPDAFTTGSSIMPHKKNPDVFELLRAHSNRLQALPNELALLTTNLPSGYHRDLQISKDILLPAFTKMLTCLRISNMAISQIIPKPDLLKNQIYADCFTVEEVNRRVVEENQPFRDAYKQVAQEVLDGKKFYFDKLNHTHQGSIGNLCNSQINAKIENIMGMYGFDRAHKAFDNLLAL